jgi:type II secretory pathway pseudopilin PulG
MKTPRHSPFSAKAFTLLEMTIVILVLLTLVGVGLFSSKKMGEWRLGREAGETLRVVYSAQRMYLADNPTEAGQRNHHFESHSVFTEQRHCDAHRHFPHRSTLSIKVDRLSPRHQCRLRSPL